MTPGTRTMPIVTARWTRGERWAVTLPGGIVRFGLPDRAAVRRVVAREAPGSALRFEGRGH